MFIGDFYCNLMNEGELYELQPDSTFSIYQVRYDPHKDINEGTIR